jgi:hypothetical protein
MNTAYGEPEKENLPFDLRHLRRPITYCLPDTPGAEKKQQFEKLTATLLEALSLVLTVPRSAKAPIPQFIPRKATKCPANFWDVATDLIPEGTFGQKAGSFNVPFEAKAYLRLYPIVAVPSIDTELDALSLVRQNGPSAMGESDGVGSVRNALGAIVYERPENGKLCHFTQLFLSRELWGVDASCVSLTRIRELYEQVVREYKGKGYIAIGYVEPIFVRALQSYLSFARGALQLPLPLRVEAGFVGIKGYSVLVEENRTSGEALEDHVGWSGEVASFETPAYEILAPFFDFVWKKCGVPRPASRQAILAQKFGPNR